MFGNASTRYAINKEGGAFSDVAIEDVHTENMASGELNGIVGSANGTRHIINGRGYNDGDPSVEGAWNGNGEEGVKVFDDTVSRPYTAYEYIDGQWQ